MGMKSEEHQEISQKMNHNSLNVVHSNGSENCEWAMYHISARCWHLTVPDSSYISVILNLAWVWHLYIALPQNEYNRLTHVKVCYCDIYCAQKIL